MVNIIDGHNIADKLNIETKNRVDELKKKGILPGIVVILIGENPASVLYTRMKQQTAAKMGMHSVLKKFPEDVSQDEVLASTLTKLKLLKQLILKRMLTALILLMLVSCTTMKKAITQYLVLPVEL